MYLDACTLHSMTLAFCLNICKVTITCDTSGKHLTFVDDRAMVVCPSDCQVDLLSGKFVYELHQHRVWAHDQICFHANWEVARFSCCVTFGFSVALDSLHNCMWLSFWY